MGNLFGWNRNNNDIPASGSMNIKGHKTYAWGNATYTSVFSLTISGIHEASSCGASNYYYATNSLTKQQTIINFNGNIIKIQYPDAITKSRETNVIPCAAAQNYSCFPSGNFILAYDIKANVPVWKPIQYARKGDCIMGADGKPTILEDVQILMLGDRDMMEMDDGTLVWSAEHSFWTQDENGKEWLWSYDKQQWLKEVKMGVFGGLLDNNSIRTGNGYKFATTNGFKHKNIHTVTQKYTSHTKLYYPRTNDVLIVIGNKNKKGDIVGYVVSGGVDEHNYDYKSFRWDYTKVSNLRSLR